MRTTSFPLVGLLASREWRWRLRAHLNAEGMRLSALLLPLAASQRLIPALSEEDYCPADDTLQTTHSSRAETFGEPIFAGVED
jgi:hypothetical protein